MICNPMEIYSGFVIPFPMVWISNPPILTNGFQIRCNGGIRLKAFGIAQGVSPGSPSATHIQALKERFNSNSCLHV